MMKIKVLRQNNKYLVEHRKEGFDKSKFKVVGNPSITEDGIASGFSTSNYIKGGGISFSKTLTFKGIKFRTGDVSGTINKDIIDTLCANFNMFILRVANNELILVSGISGTKTISPIKNNTDYVVNLEFDFEQGQCIATVTENGGAEISKTLAFTFTGRNSNHFTIGARENPAIVYPFNGLIYLPTLSVEADNQEIFNGQKDKYYVLQV